MTTKNKSSYFLHPYELSVCGYSNSGKTTLIQKLIQEFSSQYSISYYKHDAHKFEMDKEGKDTELMYSSGASQILITDSDHMAQIRRGHECWSDITTQVIDSDLLFIEGYKKSKSKKVIVLDKDLEILQPVNSGEIDNILFYVGPFECAPNELRGATYYQRDNILEIKKAIEGYYSLLQASEINGLVLVGGRSQRMQQDKASLVYHEGQTQMNYVFQQLSPFCKNVYVSARSGQELGSTLKEENIIRDKFIDVGPMGGILSAQSLRPQSAWLVVACDLPYLDEGTINHLVQNRNPFKVATSYVSSNDGLLEPLCAIYEPKSYQRMLQFFANGYKCPRKVLLNSDVQSLSLNNKKALDNVNHPHERESALTQFEVKP